MFGTTRQFKDIRFHERTQDFILRDLGSHLFEFFTTFPKEKKSFLAFCRPLHQKHESICFIL